MGAYLQKLSDCETVTTEHDLDVLLHKIICSGFFEHGKQQRDAVCRVADKFVEASTIIMVMFIGKSKPVPNPF